LKLSEILADSLAMISQAMRAALLDRGTLAWTELDRREAHDPDFTLEPQRRDESWRVIVRRAPG
jgi:hypothetical protein